MGKPKAPTAFRAEVSELKAAISDSVRRIIDAKKDRTECNADISLEKEKLEAKGIPRKALEMAMTYSEWDADSRAGFDAAYALVRETLGCPYDGQLFDKQGNPRLVPIKAKEEAPKDADTDGDEPEADAEDGDAADSGDGEETQAEQIARTILKDADSAVH